MSSEPCRLDMALGLKHKKSDNYSPGGWNTTSRMCKKTTLFLFEKTSWTWKAACLHGRGDKGCANKATYHVVRQPVGQRIVQHVQLIHHIDWQIPTAFLLDSDHWG